MAGATAASKSNKHYLIITEKGVFTLNDFISMQAILNKDQLIAKRFLEVFDLSGNPCLVNLDHIISIHLQGVDAKL